MTKRLYRFIDLADGVQRKLAREWAQMAEDLADVDGNPREMTEDHALDCLRSDPVRKYTPEGKEV